MIINSVTYVSLSQLEENIKILLIGEDTVNIYIDGQETPHIKDTTKLLFDTLKIDRVIPENINYDMAIEYWTNLFQWIPEENVRKINIIIKNCKSHHVQWLDQRFSDAVGMTNVFYQYICKFYEHRVIAKNNAGKRRSFDIYLCEEDFDLEGFKGKVNYPAGGIVRRRLNKDFKLIQ